jgi:ketosteroid isomerase-like protein
MGLLQNYLSFRSKGGPNIARNIGMGGATDRLSARSTTAGKSTLLLKEIRPDPKGATAGKRYFHPITKPMCIRGDHGRGRSSEQTHEVPPARIGPHIGHNERGLGVSDNVELLKRIYDRFNARDMETVLAALHQDVSWANGMEGGYVHGREGVRSYWTRQWAMVDPHVEPVAFAEGPKAEVIVEVHQVVRDLRGNLLADKMVEHIFRVENGLVRRFDIRAT